MKLKKGNKLTNTREVSMRKSIIPILSLILLLLGCFTTNPYLKKTELPKNIKYYSEDKQITIKPERYWMKRPNQNIRIGHSYLNNKSGVGKVIGEYFINNKNFYVVKWESYGYFFVNIKDNLFAEKYKKYLIPLDYGNKAMWNFGYEYYLIAYFQGPNKKDIGGFPAHFFANVARYNSNLKVILKLTLMRSFMMNKVNFSPTKYNDIVNKPIQISMRTGFTNEFVNFTSCPSIKKNFPISSIECLAVEKIGSKQYTNQSGMMFKGILYQTKFVIIKWNNAFYALPCNPENKNIKGFNKKL